MNVMNKRCYTKLGCILFVVVSVTHFTHSHASDMKSEAQIHGLMQIDGLFPVGNQETLSHGMSVRRARLALQGKAAQLFSFKIQPQWSSSNVIILDAYIDIALSKALAFRVGKMKTPLGVEMMQPVSALLLPERGLTTVLVPNRDIGLQLSGFVYNGLCHYTLGLGNGIFDQGRSSANFQNRFDGYGRVFLKPFMKNAWRTLQELGLGVAVSFGDDVASQNNTGLSSYKTTAQVPFSSYNAGAVAHGTRWRINPQFIWYIDSFGIISEYVLSSQETAFNEHIEMVTNTAWMIGFSYALTGDEASFRNLIPRHPWGALEVAVRYSELRMDTTAIANVFFDADTSKLVRSWGCGINYWSRTFFSAQLAFLQTFLSHDQDWENILIVRFQISL